MNRMSTSRAYRYAFNGKENDNEVKGDGGQQDYGMRIYDPRLGRFLSVDPLTSEFPWYTPYQFAGNKPIAFIDLDGAEDIYYDAPALKYFKSFNTLMKIVNQIDVHKKFLAAVKNAKNVDVIYNATYQGDITDKIKFACKWN